MGFHVARLTGVYEVLSTAVTELTVSLLIGFSVLCSSRCCLHLSA